MTVFRFLLLSSLLLAPLFASPPDADYDLYQREMQLTTERGQLIRDVMSQEAAQVVAPSEAADRLLKRAKEKLENNKQEIAKVQAESQKLARESNRSLAVWHAQQLEKLKSELAETQRNRNEMLASLQRSGAQPRDYLIPIDRAIADLQGRVKAGEDRLKSLQEPAKSNPTPTGGKFGYGKR